MAYTPTNWQTGDTVTASKLMNIEYGVANAANPFIVTLTPTAADFSGTMDKTVAEINAAYEAGRRILFIISALGGTLTAECTDVWASDGHLYPSFNAHVIDDGTNTIIFASTGPTDDGDRQIYGAHIYALSPYTP